LDLEKNDVPRKYAIIDVLIVDQGDLIKKKRFFKSLQLVLESRKYYLSEIIEKIKELYQGNGEFTLVDMDKNFKIRHVFKEVKNQKITLKPDQRLLVYAYKT
jgi:hypothetical protein